MGGSEMVVGLSDIFQIEARAILEGLKFAWAKRCPRVEIENDNSMLVTINGLVANNIYNEVRLIQGWFLKDWELKFQPILRKSNRVADHIAKEVRGEMEHLIIHEEPPKSEGFIRLRQPLHYIPIV
ncbi:hypothetical protein Gogos_000136 [Gossypium gossypioides]|uniref:RNase H type-1 domain-containing protein n=1 Tax=Gossypium gossypioides TaxID=34282 RepID=A0A7J9CXR1_GOSGO|nr:hypothetical protein [Gossypium gossypioides]